MGTGGDVVAVRQPIGVGPEMAALGRFYTDVTWEGVIREGGMGPGTPAMTGGGARHGPGLPGWALDRLGL
jgi:hypothetical protein